VPGKDERDGEGILSVQGLENKGRQVPRHRSEGGDDQKGGHRESLDSERGDQQEAERIGGLGEMAEDDFNCCNCAGEGLSGEQACECIDQDLAHRIIPCGTRKLAGQEREYRTTKGLWLTRQAFKNWSAGVGREVDPVVWFTEMGHPTPEDVKL